MIFEPISEYSTPRKCCVCMRPASQAGYNRNKLGGIDRSSKRFLCEEHTRLYPEPKSPSVEDGGGALAVESGSSNEGSIVP